MTIIGGLLFGSEPNLGRAFSPSGLVLLLWVLRVPYPCCGGSGSLTTSEVSAVVIIVIIGALFFATWHSFIVIVFGERVFSMARGRFRSFAILRTLDNRGDWISCFTFFSFLFFSCLCASSRSSASSRNLTSRGTHTPSPLHHQLPYLSLPPPQKLRSPFLSGLFP